MTSSCESGIGATSKTAELPDRAIRFSSDADEIERADCRAAIISMSFSEKASLLEDLVVESKHAAEALEG